MSDFKPSYNNTLKNLGKSVHIDFSVFTSNTYILMYTSVQIADIVKLTDKRSKSSFRDCRVDKKEAYMILCYENVPILRITIRCVNIISVEIEEIDAVSIGDVVVDFGNIVSNTFTLNDRGREIHTHFEHFFNSRSKQLVQDKKP